MERQHPFISAVGETMSDAAFFGFFIFFSLRPYIVDFSFIPMAAALLFLRIFNLMILKKSLTIGVFAAANALLGLAFVIFSVRLLSLTSFQLLQAGLCAGALAFLAVRAVYLSVSPSARPLGAVTVDMLFLLCLIVSIWQNFSSVSGLSHLMAFLILALICGIADLAFQHLPAAEKKGPAGLPALIAGAVALAFVLFSLAAAHLGKNVSNGLVSALLSLFSAVGNGIKSMFSTLEALLVYLISLLPDPPAGYEAEPYEMSDSFLLEMEERAGNSDSRGLFIFLAILAAAAAVFFLYWILKNGVLKRRLLRKTTGKNSRRTISVKPVSLRPLIRQIAHIFRSLSFLVFRSGHIEALLIRAEWYGKRHFHPRHKGETLREYLLRLAKTGDREKNEFLEKGAALLSDYGDRHLYSPENIRMDKQEILIIKKAFPLI